MQMCSNFLRLLNMPWSDLLCGLPLGIDLEVSHCPGFPGNKGSHWDLMDGPSVMYWRQADLLLFCASVCCLCKIEKTILP